MRNSRFVVFSPLAGREYFDLLLYPATLLIPTVLAKKASKNPGKTAAYPAKGKQLRKFGLAGRLAVLIGLVSLSLLAIGGGFFYWALRPIAVSSLPVEFQIPAGASLPVVIERLQRADLDLPEAAFRLLARFRGAAAKIKPGVYALENAPSPMQLLDKMVRGDVVRIDLTIPEGWTFRQLRLRLDAQDGLRHELKGMSDREVLGAVGASEAQLEGLFFPDTYRVDKGSSDIDLLRQAYRAMQSQLGLVWLARASDSPLRSPYQALVLASIIEKETGRAEDRPLIGAVFVNRLRRGMLLQTDPTVIYGLGADFDGNLRKRDLQSDTPYNTYTRPGLPPTPIAFPGRASLEAAVRPANSDALYFVARGDGGSAFSATLEAHNRAVNKFQRGGR